MKRFSSFDATLCVFLPLVFLALTLFLEQIINVPCFTACEDGPVETMQAIIMLSAGIIGVSLLRAPRDAYPHYARVFFLIGTIGAFYVALEEISYGQRIFGWMTPETWQALNDQNETNLHNTSAWLDQKPRLILEIGVIVGGLIIPALRRWKPSLLPQQFAAVFPDGRLAVTAAIAILIHVYDSTTSALGHQDWFFFDRGSEAEESYLYWFIFLYLLFKRREFKPTA